ncbi:ImmA/IrrE family metallo-endopeptidase [Enterococcus italicus]|uniref:ImmA/IrrE family metallo-endopeptidase n=1 Tax=Enterococcus italicus TaxID=246144 RepID=UPI0028AF9731|nr:ImmA/IrrE family metallo-endopeptidase [Enterococcus italicus]
MDKVEELMAAYPNINYIFDNRMPDGQSGLYVDNHIYLNPRQSPQQLAGTIAEEIGHHLTTVGDIIDQDTNLKRKQEQLARDIGATLVVSPADIINCYEYGCKTIDECVAYLNITRQVFDYAISYYARRFNGIKTENGYTIFFRENGTVGVFKMI